MMVRQQTPLPETNFVGLNTNRYQNPDLEAMLHLNIPSIYYNLYQWDVTG